MISILSPARRYPMKLLRFLLCLQVIIALTFQAACRSDDDDDSAPAMADEAPVEAPEDPPPPEPPATLFTETDQALMVYVPAGEFLMGTSAADVESYKEIFPLRSSTAFDDERPQRTVFLDAFYIDQLEVTNTQYKKFLAETGYEPRLYLDQPPVDLGSPRCNTGSARHQVGLQCRRKTLPGFVLLGRKSLIQPYHKARSSRDRNRLE